MINVTPACNATHARAHRAAYCLFMLLCAPGFASAGQTLSSLLRLEPEARGPVVAELTRAGTPIVEGTTALFLARQRGSARPRLLAGFNWFGRYQQADGLAGGEMIPIEGTHWYFLEVELEAEARVEYVFGAHDQEPWLDPHNPNTNNTFGSDLSVLTMPAYSGSRWVPDDEFHLQGTLTEHRFKWGEQSRQVSVYVPPGAQNHSSLPTAYFHDGALYVDQVPTPQIIEALIRAEEIEPLVAVFVSPINRSVEYRGETRFLDFFNGELVDFVQEHYPVAEQPARRAVIGSSRGGLGALAVAWHRSDPVFGLCGMLQPALTPATQILDEIFASDRRPLKFSVVAGRYDVRFLGDYYRLLDTLLVKGYPVSRRISSVGHSHNSWQHDIPGMLRSFFPPR